MRLGLARRPLAVLVLSESLERDAWARDRGFQRFSGGGFGGFRGFRR